MDAWTLLALSVVLCCALAKLLAILMSENRKQSSISLPQGPPFIPVNRKHIVVHSLPPQLPNHPPRPLRRIRPCRGCTPALVRPPVNLQLKEILIPLMTERRERVERGECSFLLHSYVDSLEQLEVPEDDGSARRLTEDEKLYFCCEFLMGTDSTITELEWIMANVIKNRDLQEKLWQEIEGAMAEKKGEWEILKDEEAEKMPYLKAVILEGLRRHPPNLAMIPRVAEEDIILGDRYLMPKGSFVSVSIAEIGRGEQVWVEPMQFRPERFLDGRHKVVEHLMGGKEAKMIPFGIGGRVCPGAGMAATNLKFFVANLVRVFEWKVVGDDDQEEIIDLSEEMMVTAVMKVPLRARIFPRIYAA